MAMMTDLVETVIMLHQDLMMDSRSLIKLTVISEIYILKFIWYVISLYFKERGKVFVDYSLAAKP